MLADGRMSVEPMNRTFAPNAVAGEVLAEYCVTSERGCGDEDRHEGCAENLHGHINRTPDASELWRRIERGADLVVDVARLQPFEREQRRLQFAFHRIRRE